MLPKLGRGAPPCLAVLFIIGCGSRESGQYAQAPTRAGARVTLAEVAMGPSTTIGKAGGMLDGDFGTSLEGIHIEVPPGAFAIDAQVSLGRNMGKVKPVRGTWGGLILDLST